MFIFHINVYFSGLYTGGAGNRGTGWDHLARRRQKTLGSHCRGNGIPRSLFSAPVGTGINGSYASDAGWKRDGNWYMRGMGTAVVGFYMERELQTWHGNGK